VGNSIAVIGGGIIGMSVAWRLAQAQFAVTVYEKGVIGGEASWAGAGMLAPGGEFQSDSDLARLAVESRDLYPAFVDELKRASGAAIDYQETGALDLAYSAAELTALDHRAERQAAIGIPSRRVAPEQIAIFWPRLNTVELAGGYFYPGDAFVNPRDVMAALRIVCENAGVALLEHTEAKTLSAAALGVCVHRKSYSAAVIASGAWSGFITVDGLPALPKSEPVRGHLLGYQQPPETCHTILRRGHTYLFQRANGLLIAGASAERVGFDRGLDRQAVALLEKEAALVLPHLAQTSPTEVWNGFRPSSDALHVGAWHSTRVYLAYGHYRNGILLAPSTAQQLARQISANLQTQSSA
jgi:glycine oxidase